MPDIYKVGLLVVRNGRMLLCRSRKRKRLILPGGKLEPGETELQCLHREVAEELGGVGVENLDYVGNYSDKAETDDGSDKTVHIQLYKGRLTGEPRASSEIIELVWFGPDDKRDVPLAPSLEHFILPDLLRRKLL
jgi:8-oxo-dGTP pyrophosphatase MutT (NUDIX family)